MQTKFGRVTDRVSIEAGVSRWALQRVMERVYDSSYPAAWLLNELQPDARTWVSVCALYEHPHPCARSMANKALWKVARNLPAFNFFAVMFSAQLI